MRAGCTVSRLSTWAASGPQEPPILAAPRRDAAIAVAISAVTAVVFAVVASRGALTHIQRVDDSWLRLMISARNPPVTVIAKVLNVLGLVYVTLPVRIGIAGYLAFRRRWWHLAAFAAAVLLSEALIGPVKAVYDRARPQTALRRPAGTSAMTAANTVTDVAIACPDGNDAPLVATSEPGGLARS